MVKVQLFEVMSDHFHVVGIYSNEKYPLRKVHRVR